MEYLASDCIVHEYLDKQIRHGMVSNDSSARAIHNERYTTKGMPNILFPSCVHAKRFTCD